MTRTRKRKGQESWVQEFSYDGPFIILGLMSRMTQTRFRHLTDNEVDALHAYLQSL